MKSLWVLFSACVFCCGTIAFAQKTNTESAAANKVLEQVFKQLKSFKNISYNYTRELNYASENYRNESKATVYADFQSTDTLLGFKYQAEDDILKQFFNGTEKFEINKKNKTMSVSDQPRQKSFNNLSFLYNSLITLRNAIPAIVADEAITKTIGDTAIDKSAFYVVTVTMHKRGIDYLGKNFNTLSTERNIIYTILIDKNTYLPIEVVETNNINTDFKATTFTNIKVNQPQPSELSWFYSTYTEEYKPATKIETPPLIAVGSQAPELALPLYNRNEIIGLSNLKGKVILLDFWIKNCGPCIEGIPHLNALHEKFKNKVEVLGINSYDTKEEIAWFCNKHKPRYKVLANGKNVAEKYGVSGFPTMVLIDKSGKVVYAGFADIAAIEKAIDRAL